MTPQLGTIVILALFPPDTQVFILNDNFLDCIKFSPVQKVMKLLKQMHVASLTFYQTISTLHLLPSAPASMTLVDMHEAQGAGSTDPLNCFFWQVTWDRDPENLTLDLQIKALDRCWIFCGTVLTHTKRNEEPKVGDSNTFHFLDFD